MAASGGRSGDQAKKPVRTNLRVEATNLLNEILRRHELVGKLMSGRAGKAPFLLTAENIMLSETLFYHLGRRIPSVRPLALYTKASWSAKRQDDVLVICGRSRIQLTQTCPTVVRSYHAKWTQGNSTSTTTTTT